ncbi:amino acid deaminase/aldolase [Mycobacterium sp. BMJ-28]
MKRTKPSDEPDLETLNAATSGLSAPFAVVDLDRFDRNCRDLIRRAGGAPIRVATKSVRVRSLIDRAVKHVGNHGVMAFTLPEAIWLATHGANDVLMGYPTVDRHALADLADAEVASRITLMVDDVAHLDLIEDAIGRDRPKIKVCMDIDASWRPVGVHIGARRSPLRSVTDVRRLATEIVARRSCALRGIMTYESQIAGLQDTSRAIRWVKKRSAPVIAARRAAIVDMLSHIADIELVNAGGTGSLEISSSYPEVTEVTAGSGLFGPGLFDEYHGFRPEPAALFAVPVVRRPSRRSATTLGGGYIASGPSGAHRLPRIFGPTSLSLTKSEGAGEVQTPVTGRGARSLLIGDRVWMRHAKAGELCERFNEVHLVAGSQIVDVVPTYRGERKAFA